MHHPVAVFLQGCGADDGPDHKCILHFSDPYDIRQTSISVRHPQDSLGDRVAFGIEPAFRPPSLPERGEFDITLASPRIPVVEHILEIPEHHQQTVPIIRLVIASAGRCRSPDGGYGSGEDCHKYKHAYSCHRHIVLFYVLPSQILRCAPLDDNPDFPRSFAALRMTMRTPPFHSEHSPVILNEVKNLFPQSKESVPQYRHTEQKKHLKTEKCGEMPE